jgi:diguanylate cyclase (GGDEF)-like protein
MLSANCATNTGLSPCSGEFLDAELESSYRISVRGQHIRQLRIALFVTAGLFLMMGLFDYLLLGLSENFLRLILIRCAVSVAFLVLAIALARHTQLLDSDIPLNAACLLLITSLFLIVPLRTEIIGAQLTAAVAVTLGLYLFIPNRVPWALGCCVYLSVGFLLVFHATGLVLPPGMVGATLALLLANVIGVLASLRINRLQREQFTSLLTERKTNQRLQLEIRERLRLEEELRYLAQTDDLTGLNNRRWFFELAVRELKRSRRDGTPLGFCMIDLDKFKTINDKMGHSAGDKILATVASLCREELRDTDIIGRYGGEEFVIAMPESGPADTYKVVERLRARIEQYRLPKEFADQNLTVTVGMAQVAQGEETLAPVLGRADQALYSGKRRGRNIVIVDALCSKEAVSS